MSSPIPTSPLLPLPTSSLGHPPPWALGPLLTRTTDRLLQHIASTPSALPAHSIHLAHLPVSAGGLGFRHHPTAAIPAFMIPLTRSLQYAHLGLPITALPPPCPHQTAPTPSLPSTPPPTVDRHILPSVYTHPFSQWLTSRHPPRLLRVYRHYLPAFVATYNVLNPTSTVSLRSPKLFLANIQTRGLPAKLYHHSLTQCLPTFLDSLPPDISIALPSLLSPLTSTPLLSLPRRIPSNRYPNPAFAIALKRKLRIPLFPTPCRCKCGALIDIYGDHFFACRLISKTPIHNAARDALFTILQQIAPLVPLLQSKHSIRLEPTNLLPDHPLKRPADIALSLQRPVSGPNPLTSLAIDVTYTPTPSCLSPRPRNSPSSLIAAHRESIVSKLKGRSLPNISGEDVIRTLNDTHTGLVPFTIDHLGHLGSTATHFLFSAQHPPFTPPPIDHLTDADLGHQPAIQAYQSLQRSPFHVLTQANRFWKEHCRSATFGRTYHSQSPAAWSLQALGLNISRSLASHILKSLPCIQASPQSTRDVPFLGSACPCHPHHHVILPSVPRHLPTY